MIRRHEGSDFVLITQNDHALFSEKLANHFGNERFPRPTRRDSVLTALRMHDAGWPLHDDRPTLNAQHLPLDVFEVPRPIALRVWAASAERAAAVDPYAGLLVSLHSFALSVYASTHAPLQPTGFATDQLSERFELNKFQHREVERQEQLRAQLGFPSDIPLRYGLADYGISEIEDQVIANFRLLQAMDLISLCLCCTDPPAEKTRELYRGTKTLPVSLSMTWHDQELLIDPWPFDHGRMDFSIPGRRIPGRVYIDQSDFYSTLASARSEEIHVVLSRKRPDR